MERKQKIELLRNIRDGRVSVKDLFQPLLQVWRQDKSNPDQPLYKFSNEVLSWQELKDRISNSNGVTLNCAATSFLVSSSIFRILNNSDISYYIKCH